jgi:hypothetical protein
MKTKVSKQYIDLCNECEISIKEAIRLHFTIRDLQNLIQINEESLITSHNANI